MMKRMMKIGYLIGKEVLRGKCDGKRPGIEFELWRPNLDSDLGF